MDDLQNYIQAGCLHVADEGLVSEGPRDAWLQSYHPDDAPVLVPGKHLPAQVQSALLQVSALAPLSRLVRNRWVRFSFRPSLRHPEHGVCRVYILPDDAFRGLVDRSDPRLRRDMQALLAALDVSPETWLFGHQQDVNRPPLSLRDSIRGATGNGGHEEAPPSLLHMFNTIPSPKPQPDLIKDPAYVQVMDTLATSTVPGLKTTLYSHQVRSAIVMLQRELRPGRILDPRLLQARNVGPGRGAWYYDDVTGEVLQAPRWYDGPAGGILAEEMGTGKTLICLALILATRAFPATMPEVWQGSVSSGDGGKTRPQIGSLADMAASVATYNSVPWRLYLGEDGSADGYDEYRSCRKAIERNAASYVEARPRTRARETSRRGNDASAAEQGLRVFLSHCSLLVVPMNLLSQWQEEIAKHTQGLRVLVALEPQKMPSVADILKADVLLCPLSCVKKLVQLRRGSGPGCGLPSPLAEVHFKRVIVDEGHHLGNSKMGRKSSLLLWLDDLHISARWIVTGTPATGLFGVDSPMLSAGDVEGHAEGEDMQMVASNASSEQEKKDLERLGAMASLYLRVRPWANTAQEHLSGSDRPADWAVYVMQPRHSGRSSGRRDVLRKTLDALIVRHRKADVGDLLPPVVERVVVLDGSYQDRLCLNLFAMMILFNAVQSQRTDRDYFFHPSQRQAVQQLLSNMRQATFFGGVFFSPADIATALETAEAFVAEGKVAISAEDTALLQDALAFGRAALKDRFKQLAHTVQEVPVYIQDFPGGNEMAIPWSLDGHGEECGRLTCMAAPIVRKLQQYAWVNRYWLPDLFVRGRFAAEGRETLEQHRKNSLGTQGMQEPALAGNTAMGGDGGAGGSSGVGSKSKKRTPLFARSPPSLRPGLNEKYLSGPLAPTQLVSTASAKLSYLLDAIVQHQADEKILVFYDNDNVAFYLAEHLEILGIHHLIYARGLSAQEQAQYVAAFNGNGEARHNEKEKENETETETENETKYRVLLMDLSQAAFGLDMRAASRIYFINPVLNPQVEAQAIGRARRISQKKPVTVEILVLRDSLDEVIVARRKTMTQAEHRRIKSLLDDRPIYNWIVQARILPMPSVVDGPAQMAPLQTPQYLFGRGLTRERPGSPALEDQLPTYIRELSDWSPVATPETPDESSANKGAQPTAKRSLAIGDGDHPKKQKLRVRFADDPEA